MRTGILAATLFALGGIVAMSSCQKDQKQIEEEQNAGVVNIEKGVVPEMWTPESEPIQSKPIEAPAEEAQEAATEAPAPQPEEAQPAAPAQAAAPVQTAPAAAPAATPAIPAVKETPKPVPKEQTAPKESNTAPAEKPSAPQSEGA